MPASSLKAVAVGLTDVGRQRDHNEDSFAIADDLQLFVVADGMGGHQAGDIASSIATGFLSNYFVHTQGEDVTHPSTLQRRLSDEENRLLTGIMLTNRRIFEEGQKAKDRRGMGTTIVAGHFAERTSKMVIAHVGDSRAYRVREGAIEQLTRDHSLYNDPPPHLTEAERAELPRNVITRALGMDDHVAIDLLAHDALAGDVYLLCSDGLSGMVTDEQILEVVSGADDLEEICQKLINAANSSGGDDNVTAVLIRIELDAPASDAATSA